MFLSYFFKKLKYLKVLRFNYPSQNKILIYDLEGNEELIRILLPGFCPALFSVRGEWFCAHPVIVVKFFVNYFIKKIPARVSYDLAYVSIVKPILVITLIDNNLNFHQLSTLYYSTFFCIQNGFRSHNCARSFKNLPTLFCFGQRDIDLYHAHNVMLGKTFPVGSIRSSYFLEKIVPIMEEQETYDLCFISEYLPGMEFEDYTVTEEAVRLLSEWLFVMCEYLKVFLSKNNIRLVVAGRQRVGSNSGELAFYRKYFDESVTITASNEHYLNSYRIAFQSSIVLSYCSSLGFEAMTWGKKALFFPHPKEKNLSLDNPQSVFLKTIKGDYQEFETNLENLVSMESEAFRKETQQDVDYVIDSKRAAHLVIKEQIDAIICSQKISKE